MTRRELELERSLESEVRKLNSLSLHEEAKPRPDPRSVADLGARLRKARLDYESFQTELYAKRPELKTWRGRFSPLTLRQAAELIAGPTNAILEYVITDKNVYLFVLTKRSGGEGEKLDLRVYPIDVTAKDLAEKVRGFRTKVAERRIDYGDAGTTLYDLLIRPAAEQLAGKTTLCVVPDGVLWELPFQALQIGTRFLVEEKTVFYAPSLGVLREMRGHRREGKQGDGAANLNLLAFANPSLGESAVQRAALAQRGKKLTPLPEAESEARQLAGLYGARQSTVYVGGDAREERAKAEASGFRVQTFLVTGETGTGKELVARLIHRHSQFRRGTFVAVNCGNLSPELADAELFGSAPGAYTGASSGGRAGLWELASGGTLFLDEITEAPAGVLPKLLRVLQDGQVRRLGSSRWAKVNTQVVAATNRDILTEVKEGRFRKDLYHRLSLHALRLPPLRERLEDVPLLAAHFARLYSGNTVRLSREAVELLMRFSQEYPWPGNVRELGNVIRRAVTATPVRTVSAVDLAANLPVKAERFYFSETDTVRPPRQETVRVHSTDRAAGGLEERVNLFKQHVVRETLAEYDGNVTRAARALKISRPSLYRLLKNLENR